MGLDLPAPIEQAADACHAQGHGRRQEQDQRHRARRHHNRDVGITGVSGPPRLPGMVPVSVMTSAMRQSAGAMR